MKLIYLALTTLLGLTISVSTATKPDCFLVSVTGSPVCVTPPINPAPNGTKLTQLIIDKANEEGRSLEIEGNTDDCTVEFVKASAGTKNKFGKEIAGSFKFDNKTTGQKAQFDLLKGTTYDVIKVDFDPSDKFGGESDFFFSWQIRPTGVWGPKYLLEIIEGGDTHFGVKLQELVDDGSGYYEAVDNYCEVDFT